MIDWTGQPTGDGDGLDRMREEAGTRLDDPEEGLDLN
jgi:hypothetical protein